MAKPTKSNKEPKAKKSRSPLGVFVHGDANAAFFRFYGGTRSDSSYEGWECYFDDNNTLSYTLDKGVILTQQQLYAMPKGRIHIGTTNHKHGMPECFGVINDNCLLVTQRIRDLILRAAPNDFHTLPMRVWINERPGVALDGMWFMQPTQFVDCLDRKRSTWIADPDHPKGGQYRDEVMDAARIPKHVTVFRVIDGPLGIYCRRSFMEAIVAEDFRYMTFFGAYEDEFVNVTAS
jgi:hypothetical protein